MTRLEFEIPTSAALCIATKASFPVQRRGWQPPCPLRQECLKRRHGGLRGLVARRKLLKAPGGLSFFKLQKNWALNGPERHSTSAAGCFAWAPCCIQSAFNLQSICNQFFEANLGLPLSGCCEPNASHVWDVHFTGDFAEVNPGCVARLNLLPNVCANFVAHPSPWQRLLAVFPVAHVQMNGYAVSGEKTSHCR